MKLSRERQIAWHVKPEELFSKDNERSLYASLLGHLSSDLPQVKRRNLIYNGRTASVLVIPTRLRFEEILEDKPTMNLLDGVRRNAVSSKVYSQSQLLPPSWQLVRLDHPNVAQFFGLVWPSSINRQYSNMIVYLSEMGNKGTLRQLLDNEDLVLGWELRLALISDILQVQCSF